MLRVVPAFFWSPPCSPSRRPVRSRRNRHNQHPRHSLFSYRFHRRNRSSSNRPRRSAYSPRNRLRRRANILRPRRARQERHGGGAGGARRPDRRRDPAEGRQRGRRRGRDRLRARGHLSERRQYRRRRLHGDPSRRRATKTIAIDYRETAPAATTRDIFLDDEGEADPAKSRDSGLAIGVPGTVAGLALAHEKYGSGKFTLAQLIAPAIALARDGIPGRRRSRRFARPVRRRGSRAGRRRRRSFCKPTAAARAEATRLVQTDLAAIARGDRARRPARLLRRRRSPRRSSPRCARPAA